MADGKEDIPIPAVATPTVTTKKVDPPGKKKVIKRLVKNAKTGEVIKTEIVRIDVNGETTITSYPAGTPVPNLQPAGKKLSRSSSTTDVKKEDLAKAELPRSDVGPSVPVNVPGLEDLLEKEKQLIKAKLEMEQQRTAASDSGAKKNEENLEAALISIAKRRHKDPKARRRGLAASTMPRRAESDDDDEDKDDYPEDTDYRSIQTHADDEEENKRRKERHRRRREKKHREKPAAYRDREANDSGIDGTLDQRPYDPEDEEQELHPLEEAELLAKQLQAAATLKQQKEAELANQPPEVAMDEVPSPSGDKAQMSEISDEDLEDKPKKKKKKHKKQKKKKKKRRRGSDEDRSDLSDRDRRSRSSTGNEPSDIKAGLTKEDIDEIRKSRSRSKSFSSLSLSSISTDFSESFDFAEVNPMAVADNARGGFRGRGNFPFRGRGMFRGFPMRGRPPRGGFRGGWAGFPGMFPPEAMMDPMGNPMFMGPGGPGMWPRGPWPMMGAGRGGLNNFDDGGIGIYVEEDSESKRSRSYSSYSSYSSRSRSRRRRRHRHSSSRSYSSYSRSSRSYSRSYSRSSRSYSRSYSRSSYSSYSRSRSRSRSKRSGYSTSSRSRSPHFRDIYTQGALEEAKKQEEEVPWWAEFDKTYEIQKQAEKEAKLKMKAETSKEQSEATMDDSGLVEQGTTLQGTSYDFADMTSEDIDVVRTVMSLVDKATHDQDPEVEDVRRCVSQLLEKVCDSPDLQTPESAAKDIMNNLLDQVCPDDPDTLARRNRLGSKIVEFPQIVDDESSKLLRWYTIACHVTKQTRALRHRALASQQDDKDSRSEEEDHKKSDEKRGRRGRRRRRRRKHRGRSRSYSRSSYSSSGSEKQQKLNLTEEQQKSLQQAQQLLILQQQQLQAAGILPKNLALPLASVFPDILPASSSATPVPEPELLSQRWDKDLDALLKTKSKDDITRKLMQRMKEKKGDDASPFTRTKSGDVLNPEKVFSGAGSLKSRKIAISSIDKSKVFDDVSSLKKSEIAAAQASIEELSSRDQERLRAQEQREKLAAWSDEQKSLKEEVKRKMREEIEKAERAKKELIKEQMLEAEKQKEIMRIREEVREQIKQEIRDEIAKQRKQVLEDPELKSQIMELEALRQSKISKSESGTKPYIKPLEESFVMEQDKHKEEMDQWIEKHGKKASEMDVDEMRKMQMVYMQQLHHWSQQQQKAYMQWYWHQQQHYKQHSQRGPFYGQQSRANEESMDFPHDMPRPSNMRGSSMEEEMSSDMKQGSTFTHAPSQDVPADDMEGTTHTMPPRGLMSAHAGNHNRAPMHRGPRPNMPNRFPPREQFRGTFPNNEMMPRRGPPDLMMNQQRFPIRHQQDMQQRMRHPFQEHRESNQGPIHQFPPSEFDMHSQEDFQRMNTPVSGLHGQVGMNRFERPPFEPRGGPRFDGRPRAPFEGHRLPAQIQQRPTGPFDQRMRPPFDQQHQQRPRGPFDPHMRPQFDQRMRPPFDPRVSGPQGQQIPPLMQNQGMENQFNQAGPPMRHGIPQISVPGQQQQQQQPPMMVPVDENAMKNIGSDQPPPPGVDAANNQPIPSVVTAPPGVEELKPPGEETSPAEVPKESPKVEEQPKKEGTPPTKSSKKKKKKHRKHKKRRERSSSSDDDAHDAIVKQLEALQAVEEGELVEVEEGEVKSDDEKKPSAIAAAAKLLKQLKAREKKRHKKRKKKRRETSSSEEEEKKEPVEKDPQSDTAGLPPPPFFHSVQQEASREMEAHHPEMTVAHMEPLEHGRMHGGPQAMKHPVEEQRFPSEYRGTPYTSHIQQGPERYSLPPNPQGAGEPHLGGNQHPPERNDHFTHYIGPGGDHTLGQNPVPDEKRPPSPLPVVIPDDPREMEMWARRMTEKYSEAKPPQQHPGKPEFQGRKVEKIPSLMDKYIPEPEPRRIAALSTTLRGARRGEFPPGRQHPDDDRVAIGKRKAERGRGRGRKRKRGMPRNYHDWDQPVDDGLIYYYSGSDSSGWGSDKNFDDLLAKKKRETMQKPEQDKLVANFTSPPRPIHVTNTRRPSPGPREAAWDRHDVIGEPQGIPVIGGVKPQPIPSLANRGGQSRGEYEHMGRMPPRDDEFKIQPPDFWGIPNEQQAMLRNTSQWDPQTVAGGAREPPRGGIAWPRPNLR